MNKKFYLFIASFMFAFIAAMTLMHPKWNASRVPANSMETVPVLPYANTVGVAPGTPTTQQAPGTAAPPYNTTDIASVYNSVVMRDTLLKNQIDALTLQIQAATMARSNTLAADPNRMMHPNGFDQNVAMMQIQQGQLRVARDNNITTGMMQMSLVFASIRGNAGTTMTIEAERDYMTKANALISLYMQSSMDGNNLFAYPYTGTTPMAGITTNLPAGQPAVTTPVVANQPVYGPPWPPPTAPTDRAQNTTGVVAQ